MSKNYSNKRRAKYVLLALACTATFSLTGLVAACTPEESKTETEKKTSREDTQLLKNGNFEFFNVPDKVEGEPDPVYLINSPNNWTHGGTTSYTMSGIVSTADKVWEKFASTEFAGDLDVNNALDSSASDYKENHVDYNGMKSSDLPYKDSYAAIKGNNDEDGETDDNAKDPKTEFIANPKAHNIFERGGKLVYVYVDENGEEKEKDVLVNPDTNEYYLGYDEVKKEYVDPIGHVLMLHNYSNSTHNGIAQNYASMDITLTANTSAEISLWVKTSDLLCQQGTAVQQDRGANITVTHTAGNTTLSDFKITSIDTQKLIEKGYAEDKYNGWVQYTIYVNSCNFASSTITLKLGLGDDEFPVEGYAFFDDVNVTKYIDLTDEGCTYSDHKADIEAKKASCTITSDPAEKIFAAGPYERNGGKDKDGKFDERFADSFHYLLDIASENKYEHRDLNGAKAALTVDKDNYISSLNLNQKLIGLGNIDVPGKTKLPDALKNIKVDGEAGNGLDTRGDLLAYVDGNYVFNESHSIYFEQLNDALRGETIDNKNYGVNSAYNLPGGDNSDNKMLVMLSATGAAYTTSFDLTVKEEEYQIISFWVKTSDMTGKTAATIKITEDGNKDNTNEIKIDTSKTTIDIDEDRKDIYHGWAQCFFLLHNEYEKTDDHKNDKTIHVEFSFGNTSLKDTTITSYKAGWAALANMQALVVNEDVFSYANGGNNTASLTFKEDDEKKTTSPFDEVYGNQTYKIKDDIVDPSSYVGVNGGSSYVKKNDAGISIPFDDTNASEYAGLINKEYFLEGNYKSTEWYGKLLESFGVNSTMSAQESWNKIFGENDKCVQPLVIINNKLTAFVKASTATETTYYQGYYVEAEEDYTGDFIESKGKKFRAAKEEDGYDSNTAYYSKEDVVNYGFVGNNKTVAANGFTTVSVRVKVSEGAVAYIYLVDTSAGKKVLDFSAPAYTFWYDEDGNVLKGKIDEKATLTERRENVLYTLRKDGLYEDKDGKLYANTWNYTKLYTDESQKYYDADGNPVRYDDLVAGETYYKEGGKSAGMADHFLANSDNYMVYEYKDGKYHYIVDGKTQDEEVFHFDTSYARYDYSWLENDDKKIEYYKEVPYTNGEWVTVNFVIRAGSESKNYRLELWSGERDEYTTAGNTTEKGAVLFDYSYSSTSISDNSLMEEYENKIIKAYQKILQKADKLGDIQISTAEENIEYYRDLVNKNVTEDKLKELIAADPELAIINNYTAHYYTFSLYDSNSFLPFNQETASELAKGYNYSISDYEESLAYLEVDEGNTYTVFTDYSTIDQSIDIDMAEEEEEEEQEEEKEESNTNILLLASSILLVAALIVAIIAILVRDGLKKIRRKKAIDKNPNKYNQNKANRYIRRLGIKKEEIEEVDNSEEAVEEPAEQPAEPVEEPVEQPAEQSDEPAESEQTTDTETENNEGSEE